MNWASSHPVKRKVFQGAPVQYGWLLQAGAGWDKKVITKRKEGIDSVKVTFIWETDSKGLSHGEPEFHPLLSWGQDELALKSNDLLLSKLSTFL